MLTDLVRSIVIKLSVHEAVDGFWLGYDDNERDLASKVKEALSLIKSRDPLRYARMSKDLRRIFVTVLAGHHGQFLARDHSCDLDPRFIRASSPELIASVIVHEATHARLHRVGIRYSEPVRGRIERVCTRRQIAFTRKLHNPEPISQLTWALNYPDTTWSDDALTARREAGSIEALRYLFNGPDCTNSAVLYVARAVRWIRQSRAGAR